MRLSDVLIVLARPREAGNIGAVCRAMMNMGLSRLRVVPGEDGLPPVDEIRARAVHASEIWEGAEIFPRLDAALSDIPLVIGTSRRMGSRRVSQALSARETAAYLRDRPGQAALVFGNERTGLDSGEMRLCSIAAYIPASGEFPSLNLSHAAQIFCYELHQCLAPSGLKGAPGRVPLNQGEITGFVRRITDSLESLGFYKQPGREYQERFFRDVLSRAALGRRETEYLTEIFIKAAGLARKKREN